MKDKLTDFINSLDVKQLTDFITLYNSFYDNTNMIQSKYLNILHKDISSVSLNKLLSEEIKNRKQFNRIGGIPLELTKWYQK